MRRFRVPSGKVELGLGFSHCTPTCTAKGVVAWGCMCIHAGWEQEKRFADAAYIRMIVINTIAAHLGTSCVPYIEAKVNYAVCLGRGSARARDT